MKDKEIEIISAIYHGAGTVYEIKHSAGFSEFHQLNMLIDYYLTPLEEGGFLLKRSTKWFLTMKGIDLHETTKSN